MLAVLAVAPAGAQTAPPKPAPSVTCATHTGSHRLVIHAHELRERLHIPQRFLRHLSARERRQLRRIERLIQRTPAEIVLERRIDEITVVDQTSNLFELDPFAEPAASLRNCGPPPTVDTIDSVAVKLGKHSRSANLHLDLRFGALAPGATDEGDGSSEIELEGRLGGGTAAVQMTRGDDTVLAKRLGNARDPGPTTVNLNAAEPSPDADLRVGHQSSVLIKGGGGNDSLSSAGDAADPGDLLLVLLLEGGQGDDRLTGGDGSDALLDGPGDDRIKAGVGSDAVISVGHGHDHVDCGPGFDLAVVNSLKGVRHCEKVLTPEDLHLHNLTVDEVEPLALRKRLPSRVARDAVMRLLRADASR